MQLIKPFFTPLLLGLIFSTWTTTAKSDSLTASEKQLSGFGEPQLAQTLGTEQTTYFLTMTLPESAGNGFSRLSFAEQNRPSGAISLRLELPKTTAFIGTANQRDRAIAVKETWIDETGTLWIEFAAAVAPKTQITIALKPRQAVGSALPEFSIAAYPAAQNSGAVLVGTARLQAAR